ncbi:MAG: DUF6056 family protein [Paludibacteraceae bacterium]
MRHFFRQFTKQDYIFFALCGVVYFLLIRQYIPCNWDDLSYRFVCGEDAYNYIDSIGDVLMSNVYAYLHINGRFLVHCFVQFFCGFGGKQLFFICSTLMFLLLLMSILYIVRKKTHSNMDKYWLLLGLLLLIPIPGVTFIGTIAFVVNYMWSAAIYTFFLCLYFHIKEDNISYHWWQNILLVLFALVCGSWQESFCIGIAGALFFYHIVHIKETHSSLLYMVIAFGIGACICIFTPSNFSRSEALGLSIYSMRNTIVQMLKHVPAVSVVVFLVIISLIIDLHKKTKSLFVQENAIFFLSSLFSILFALIISFQGGEYQLTIIAIFSIILSIRFIYRYFTIPRKAEYTLAILIFLFAAINYVPAYYYRQKIHNSFAKVMTNYNTYDYCIDGELESIDREVLKGSFYRRYIHEFALYGFYTNTIIAEKFSRYLNKSGQTDCTLILPESKERIIATCIPNNACDSMLYASTRYSYYIIRLPLDIDYQQYKVCYNAYPITHIDKLKDKILHRDARPFSISLQDNTIQHRRQFCTDTWRYIIVEPASTNRRVADLMLQQF